MKTTRTHRSVSDLPNGDLTRGRAKRYPGRSSESCAADMEKAVALLEGRWKMMILAHIYGAEVLRFSDLERAIPGISQKMLVQQLRILQCNDLVIRIVYPLVPPKVEYRLTELGEALEHVFFAILDWSVKIKKDGNIS